MMDEDVFALIAHRLNGEPLPDKNAAALRPNAEAVNGKVMDGAGSRLRVDRAPLGFDTLRSLHIAGDRS